jgi:hypothetical protein
MCLQFAGLYAKNGKFSTTCQLKLTASEGCSTLCDLLLYFETKVKLQRNEKDYSV